MPSGKTHDQITLLGLPLVTGCSLLLSQNPGLTLTVSGGYLFSGLMFGPDLDIRSCQFRRWGWLRWLWLPYRKLLRHRSFWSHGPLVGTALRLIYLAGWGVLLLGLLWLGDQLSGQLLQEWSWDWPAGGRWLQSFLSGHPRELLALVIGLELGSLSHTLSDGLGSWVKGMFRSRRS